MGVLLAERRFEVEASQDRIWRLIGKVIFSCLPGMEKIEILDENNFQATLRTKVWLIELCMKLKGEMVNISPPQSFVVKLRLESPRGLFKMNQRVEIATESVEMDRTAIACVAMAERMGILFRVLLFGEARRFARSAFHAMEKRLKDLV